ncbi:MAG: DUF3090 family protein [Acidimicrobiia bacterium]|nr:DUF3090 family protein [Acidimicrobiia bacterium]MDH4363366.1 DUF3090 family protein [Acidimicrobiia bacterium]MDH5291072.1 DUF3090 family protein [Acidimicrobiia bacterium]
MGESYEFREVTHFTAGTEGAPGQRTFFLQVGDDTSHVSVKLEKDQVAALAQFLRSVLDDLPVTVSLEDTQPVPLREPNVAEWVVGQIAVGVAEAEAEVVVVVDELVIDDDEDEDDDLDLEDLLDDDDDDDDEMDSFFAPTDRSRIRAHINATQAAQFIVTSEALMSAGRPPCRLCGQPLDPRGHACPRLN